MSLNTVTRTRSSRATMRSLSRSSARARPGGTGRRRSPRSGTSIGPLRHPPLNAMDDPVRGDDEPRRGPRDELAHRVPHHEEHRDRGGSPEDDVASGSRLGPSDTPTIHPATTSKAHALNTSLSSAPRRISIPSLSPPARSRRGKGMAESYSRCSTSPNRTSRSPDVAPHDEPAAFVERNRVASTSPSRRRSRHGLASRWAQVALTA